MRTTPLAWDGYRNVRDLGGVPTPVAASGTTTRGRVARGPRRELLTATGWDGARRWGLRTVVDLRCAYEVGRRPTDPDGPATAPPGVRVVLAPTEDQEHPEFRAVCMPILDSPAYWAPSWRILPGHVRGALEAMASAEPGVLVHCSAGRDRTGMISALLLANAGVAPEDVADDYAASVRAMAGTAHHAPTVDRQSAWSEDRVEAWLADVVPVVLDAAADPAGAFDLLGVEDTTRERLRDLLTT